MNQLLPGYALVTVLLGAQVAAAQNAAPQENEKAEAENHFLSGLALFKAEKYDAAALELEASVKLYPTKSGLFNLVSIYKVLSRYNDALKACARLDQEYGDRLDATMRSAVEKARTEIERLVAKLDLQVEPKGASVAIDGRKVGESPFIELLLVDPGEHTIVATLSGYRTATTSVQLLSGQKERVKLELEPVPAAEATVPPIEGAPTGAVSPPNDGAGGKKLGPVPVVVAGVLTVGLGVTTIVLGVKTGDREEEALAAHSLPKMDEAKKLQTAGRVMLGLTGAGLVTTAVLLIFTDFHREKSAPASARLDGVFPTVLEGGAGVAVAGRF